MQVIEKVKVVPEGYNGAGMDGYGRRDVNGKANAGLTLGIIGTALGAWALFGNNRRSTGLLGAAGGGGMLGDGSTNINVVGAGIGAGTASPSAFQAWAKSCEDTLALQGGLYQWALTQQNQRFQDRQVIANCLRNGLVVTLMKRLLPVLLTSGSKMMISMATRYGSTSTRCNPYYN